MQLFEHLWCGGGQPSRHGRLVQFLLLTLVSGFMFQYQVWPTVLLGHQNEESSHQSECLRHAKNGRCLGDFMLHIKVLAFDRVNSTQRCLGSLEAALYDSDKVALDIFIDFPFSDGIQPADASHSKIAASHEVLSLAESFVWSHGPKRVHYRSQNVGLQPQWLEAWWPESVNDFAFVVEDDMEVSRMFYRYFKRLLYVYYYNDSNYDPSIWGVSFQRQRFIPGLNHAHYDLGAHRGPYLYSLVGTWGQFLFPEPWKAFRLWYDEHRYNSSQQPVLDNMKTTTWYRQKGKKIWTPWIIKWAHATAAFNLYPQFPGKNSLSVSHREVGVNFHVKGGADGDLYTQAEMQDEQLWEMPPTQTLPRFNFCFHKVPRWELARSPTGLLALANTTALRQNVIVLMGEAGPTGQLLTRNWLCYLEGRGLSNYLLVVQDADEGAELVRRGHPTALLSACLQPRDGNWAARSAAVWTPGHLQLLQQLGEAGYNVLALSAASLVVGVPWRMLDGLGQASATYWKAGEPGSSLFYVRAGIQGTQAWHGLQEVDAQGAGEEAVQASLDLWGVPLSPLLLEEVQSENGSLPLVVPEQLPVLVVSGAATPGHAIERLQRGGLWGLDDYDRVCKAVHCHRRQ